MSPRLRLVLRKAPYYASSLLCLARIARVPSIARCVLSSDKRLELRDGLTLDLSAVIDLLVVKETFVDDVYGLAGLAVSPGDLIVDVGAGVGDFTLAAARRFPQSEVHAFEPNPRAFALLDGNVRRYGPANVRIAQLAVGLEESYELRGLSAGPRATAAGSSASTDDAAVAPGDRLDRLLPERPIALLKIDCEGMELDVLRSAPRVLVRTGRAAVEYHRQLLEGSDRLVAELLSQRGFETRVREDRYDDAIGYVEAARVTGTRGHSSVNRAQPRTLAS